MQRHSRWISRLDSLARSSQPIAFQWGLYDCGQFVRRAVREMTGIDVLVAAGLTSSYTDEASAEAFFLNGHADLGAFAATIAAANSMPEITPITFARRGNVVWVDNGTTYGALGIVSLDGKHALCMGATGLVRVGMHRWRRAWKVGI